MAVSTIVKNFADGVISLADGTGTPVTLTVPMTNGDFTVTGLKKTLKETVAYQTRGTLHTKRHTALIFPTGSFSAMVADYSDASAGNVIDFLLGQNAYSANISVDAAGANAEVYTCDITLTVEGTDHGDAADHTIVCTDCEFSLDLSEGDPNTVSVSFTVYGTVTET